MDDGGDSMDFTPRMQQILQRLLSEEDFVSEQALADDLGISKRTVQRELDGTAGALASYGLQLQRKKKAGLKLIGPADGKEKLTANLQTASAMDFTDKHNRRRYLLFEILRDRTPKKLFYYSQLLGVSEATAASDLESLTPWLQKNNLAVLKKQGYGVVLTGSEKDYREAMRRFISETTSAEDVKELHADHEALSQAVMNVTDKGIYKLLNSHTIQRVYAVLKELHEERITHFTDAAKIGLVIHIAIAIERVASGQLQEEPSVPPSVPDDEDSALARRILKGMENEFHLSMPAIEVSYLLLHIKGAKIRYSGSSWQGPDGLDESALLGIIDAMIDAFDPQYAYDLRCDDEFIRGLFVHLQPTIVRLKHHLNIINPLLDDIQQEYASIFQKARRAADVLARALDTTVSEEEIGYLTIHFGAALERLKGKKAFTRKVVIGIVCASGFGLARLMMTRLQNKLPSHVELHTYGKDDLTESVLNQTDFFVSTLPLQIPGADVLRTSPLITGSELQHILGKIDTYFHIRKDPGLVTPSGDTFFISPGPDAPSGPGNGRPPAPLSAIHRPGTGYICPSRPYLSQCSHGDEDDTAHLFDAIIRRERLNSQIFPDQGFALLHCRTQTVRQSLFYTCVPDGPAFEDDYFKGIATVLLLIMPEDEYRQVHTDVLGFISSSLVSDDAFYQAILGHDPEKIRCHLQRILKTYFESALSL
jgi:mannitol operon transcriptional antiterminator